MHCLYEKHFFLKGTALTKITKKGKMEWNVSVTVSEDAIGMKDLK